MATIRSERPSCVWVSPSDINGRIDATYFDCDYLPLDSFLAHFPKSEVLALDRFLSKPRRVLYQKTTSFALSEAPDGAVPFISGVDIDGATMTINWESVRYVEQWMHEKYPKGRLVNGSLLIKVKGPHQHTAFVTKADRTALVSGTVFFAGVRGINPYYLAAYLSSQPGNAWRTRLRTNTTVEFIGNEELRAVPVLLPDPRIQDYIGAKVELAERCRGRANTLRGEALTRFDHLLKTDRFQPARDLTNLIGVEQLSERLTSEFYLPRYFDLDAHLGSLGLPLKPIARLLRERIIRSSTPEASAANWKPPSWPCGARPSSATHAMPSPLRGSRCPMRWPLVEPTASSTMSPASAAAVSGASASAMRARSSRSIGAASR